MIRFLGASAALAALALAPHSAAHHSFAVYFDPNDEVTLEGTVTSFRFTNPHGTIVFDVTGANGQKQSWRAETNAPVVLQRRGWDRRSLAPGQTITIRGWRARDGRPYMRMAEVRDAAGQRVGDSAFGQGDN